MFAGLAFGWRVWCSGTRRQAQWGHQYHLSLTFTPFPGCCHCCRLWGVAWAFLPFCCFFLPLPFLPGCFPSAAAAASYHPPCGLGHGASSSSLAAAVDLPLSQTVAHLVWGGCFQPEPHQLLRGTHAMQGELESETPAGLHHLQLEISGGGSNPTLCWVPQPW